ncbi:hypothetical protein [Luteimonas panaciterrae]|uniref:hypothetical protein n=1 Tax=Luteimonas panaciterrae TaxID=363885 RepID=UPI001CF93961|nr:hypothetical protein [Luteimonas panaciterrae]
MKTSERDTATSTTTPAHQQDRAAQSAESEAMPAISPLKNADIGVFDRITSYVKKEYASIKIGQDITLEQLFANLSAATDNDRLLRKQSASLKFLIASDIKDAKKFPTQGIPSTNAKPMSAWRERYNGLDRFLPRPV